MSRDRRWSFVRATEFFAGDGKPDSLDIRGMTAAAKGVASKRHKFRMNVARNGVTIYGSKPCPNTEDLHSNSNHPKERIFIEDPRAPCLTIEYQNEQYKMMPSIERFSAHTGVCQILGTKSIRGGKHKVQVGDILRFGSVGLLVTEIDTNKAGKSDNSLSNAEIQHLTQRLICQDEVQNDVDSGLDTDEEMNDNYKDNDGSDDKSSKNATSDRLSATRTSIVNVCYVCYDEHEDNNPLIAPCKCSGDTKYIHLNCLKRWNMNGDKNEICTVLDENETRTCSICKSQYPSKIKLPNSNDHVSLLPDRLDAPCIMFQIVTKHSSSTLNMSTKYQLSYKTFCNVENGRPLLIGRSSQCDLVLKYRTVSTIHAEVHYQNGEFFVKDAGSSNGTLRYIYRPLLLNNSQMLHVKFGRTVLSIKPTKKLRLPSLFGIGRNEQHSHVVHEDGERNDNSRALQMGRAYSAESIENPRIVLHDPNVMSSHANGDDDAARRLTALNISRD